MHSNVQLPPTSTTGYLTGNYSVQ
uniref:Uncharacterized protein n=1 Tax=Arundo donax TaxID=35708 RepID=A0A0A9HI99_ARUDO